MVWRTGPFSTGMPSTLPSCPTRMTSPMPALNPVSTGSEIKLARKPRRSSPASSKNAPTSSASVEAATR